MHALPEQLLPNCPPVSEWSTNAEENGRIAPDIDATMYPFMAAVARQRQDLAGHIRSSGTAPGYYRLETNQAIDGNDLTDGTVISFTAHADSDLYQSVIVNDGPPYLLFTDKLEMGPRWLRKDGVYTIQWDGRRFIWVLRNLHEIVRESGVAS
jgi:hypothetical protein